MDTATSGRIVQKGAGGFLNPPTHPSHTMSVETGLGKRPESRGSIPLDAAVTCDWLDEKTRRAAKAALDAWTRPPLDHPAVQDWILQILGYFAHCYRGPGDEPECWHAANLTIVNKHTTDESDPTPSVDDHAGVHFIRRFYQEFVPSDEHLANAYWGEGP